jgi:hypothetical protein
MKSAQYVPSQTAWPAGQLIEPVPASMGCWVPPSETGKHAPSAQYVPPGHTRPHAPQFEGSIMNVVQTVPPVPFGQGDDGATHADAPPSALVLVWHAPFTQLVPAAQTRPHLPQFPLS